MGRENWDGAELVWDRKAEGGFPELRVLKQRIRELIAPQLDLGHSDKGGTTKKENEEPEKKDDKEPEVADYSPRFKC